MSLFNNPEPLSEMLCYSRIAICGTGINPKYDTGF
jgi:hypothetical protein